MGLFYALLYQKISFEVCTVDHQSRSAIALEVEALTKLCQKHGVVFHLKRVVGISPGESNLEDRYREKRYALFQEVYSHGNFDGLLLGHHADDQVETILKRFFEGASIRTWGGIAPVSARGTMKVIRPFIETSKEEIRDWLKTWGASWFEDETNQDERYLRARMRGELIPLLREKFGKEITKNILNFGLKMRLLGDHFAQTGGEKIEGPIGCFYPLQRAISRLEAEFFLRDICDEQGLCASREELERMSLAIESKELGIEIRRPSKRLILDHHGIYLERESKVDYSFERGETGEVGWQGVVKGKVVFFAPEGGFELKKPSLLTQRLPWGVTLKKWYTLHKVPAFLRERIPVIFNEGKLVGECLTGINREDGHVKWVLTFK